MFNPYYSQCLPGAVSSSSAVAAVAAAATTKAVAAATTTKAVAAAAASSSTSSATGLDKAFKAKGRVFVGTASDSDRFSNPTDSQVTVREFGSVTPENSMKWDAVSGHSGFVGM